MSQMMRFSLVLLCLLLLVFYDLNGQQWHKIYFPNKPTVICSAYEFYDKGYVMGGNFEPHSIPTNGLIIKTDVNGEMLWSKTVSSTGDFTRIIDISPTNDKGFILTGITGEQSNYRNPFIMKLNVCAELEWCRIYNTPNVNDEWGQSIYQIPGGYIALFSAYGVENPLHERIWLYRLDNSGDLIWKQVYAQSDTAIYDELSMKMSLDPYYHFIINGICYYPDPGSPWPQILRPFIVKTDSTGTLEWELPWSVVNCENFYGESYSSVIDNLGTIYSASRHIIIGGSNAGDKPGMIKTDSEGNEISYTDFFPESLMGTTYTINWFADSTIALGYGWTDTTSSVATIGVVKCDRSGNILKTNPMFISQHLFADAVTTFNDKLLLVGGFWDGIWRSHAYKLNADLEYDTIYDWPFVYDSLCSHPIPSDTIKMDCVLVGMDDEGKKREKTKLVVYPNPVSDVLQIRLPEQIGTTQQSSTFQISTYYSRWKEIALEIYDVTGKCLVRQLVPYDQKLITLSIPGWKNGLYLIRLVYQNQTVATTTFIKVSIP